MPTHIPIKNTNQRNQLKVQVETLVDVPQNEKSKTNVKTEWIKGVVTYLKPSEAFDVWVAPNQRITVTEMPT